MTQQTQLNALLAQLQGTPNNQPLYNPLAPSNSNPSAAAVATTTSGSLPSSLLSLLPSNMTTTNGTMTQEFLMNLMPGFSNFVQQQLGTNSANGLAHANNAATPGSNLMLSNHPPPRDPRVVENELKAIIKNIHEATSNHNLIRARKTQLDSELKQIEMEQIANESSLSNLNGMKQRLEAELRAAGGRVAVINNMMTNEYDPMNNVRDPRSYPPQTSIPTYNNNSNHNNPMMNHIPSYLQSMPQETRAVTPPDVVPENVKVASNQICNNYNTGLCDGNCGMIHACSFCKSSGHNFSLCRKPDLCVNFQKNFCVNAKCDRLHVCYMCHSENHGFKDCTRYKDKYGNFPDTRLDSHKWCLYFQAAGVCERSTCTVSHKCVNCGGDHPAKDCALNSTRWLCRLSLSLVGPSSSNRDDRRDRDHRDRDRERDREYRDMRDREFRDSRDSNGIGNERWLHDRHDDTNKRKLDAEREEEIRRKRLHIPTVPCTLWNDNDGYCRFGDK
ncbi:hypothetical protein SeLEV6574_g06085 [Synchytrium endobioticum]|uniref:C3H1-type domain-containing protein n=1 Tax=Synchytrium endobioticum TaxID=286115 RepID=A0A507CQL8_9FUNG|nr:hypothetical protein SeLEV6574_g06085 [Synchytrium endobioticum]